MMHNLIRVCFMKPPYHEFDYLMENPDPSLIGCRVATPFRNGKRIGVITAILESTAINPKKLKTATLLDQTPLLDTALWKLCQFASQYYHEPFQTLLALAFPQRLRDPQNPFSPEPPNLCDSTVSINNPLSLNTEQQDALECLQAQEEFGVFVLEGVTGSGKTEVYFQTIARHLKLGKQILVLVPEINLTPQLISRFEARFQTSIVSIHSRKTTKQRADAWVAAQNQSARIIIGTRSSLFTPIPHLGLIVVDECHDTSFKQQDGFYYQAVHLAIQRANFHNVPIILGSATPSLEQCLHLQLGHYQHLKLTQRAKGHAPPKIECIDMRAFPKDFLSPPILQAMEHTLNQEQQVLLFLNRRGFAPVVLCPRCEWHAFCKRCDTHMVFHETDNSLHCHQCCDESTFPTQCPECNFSPLVTRGWGTQRLEKSLETHFPNTPVIRLDRDTTKKVGSLEAQLQLIHNTKSAIIIGTQMVAKGHHFPHLQLVGVLEAEYGLHAMDCFAKEQFIQLIIQVAGRAGRESKGKVLLQTQNPEHPLLPAICKLDYGTCIQTLLAERESAQLPPFYSMAIIRVQSDNPQEGLKWLQTQKERFSRFNNTEWLGPTPSLRQKKQDVYHCQMHLLNPKRPLLHALLEHITTHWREHPPGSKVSYHLDRDPLFI